MSDKHLKGTYQMDADEQRTMRKALEASSKIVGATDNHRLEQQRRLLDRIAKLQAENERLRRLLKQAQTERF